MKNDESDWSLKIRYKSYEIIRRQGNRVYLNIKSSRVYKIFEISSRHNNSLCGHVTLIFFSIFFTLRVIFYPGTGGENCYRAGINNFSLDQSENEFENLTFPYMLAREVISADATAANYLKT